MAGSDSQPHWRHRLLTSAVSCLVGTGAGATLGATLGAAVSPGLGAIVGGPVGAVLGGFLGFEGAVSATRYLKG